MAGDVKLDGFDELATKLRALVPAMRKRVLRNSLAAGARLVRDEAKRQAPVLSSAAKAPYRKPGTVRDAITVRTSKIASRAGDVGVFVNVKPAKKAKFKTKTTKILGLRIKSRTMVRASDRGAKSRNDPFYWRFLEFGTKKMQAQPFLQEGAKKLPQALDVFTDGVGKWLAKVNASGRVQP